METVLCFDMCSYQAKSPTGRTHTLCRVIPIQEMDSKW